MDDNLKENLKKVRNIENKYGIVMFRMGLSHLVDVGHRHLDDTLVEENIQQIVAQGEEDEANGVHPIMTPEYKCEIIRCAAELAKFSIWTLFAYIKKYVEVGSL